MSDFRTGAGSVQNEPGASCHNKKEEFTKDYHDVVPGGPQNLPEVVSLVKGGTIRAAKVMTTTMD